MNKLLQFIKTKFLTKKFLSFGVIGVVNTVIHLVVYAIFYDTLKAGPFLSNTVAFISASTFSYFANAIFTFKPKNKSTMQFSVVMLVFLIRLLISNLLTTGFDYILQNWIGVDYEIYRWASKVPPFVASVLLIPIAFFALDYVFKKTDVKKEKNHSA